MDAAGGISMEEIMKESELTGKVHSAVYHQYRQRVYAAPADVLVDIGVLPKQKYESAVSGSSMHMQSEKTFFYYEADWHLCKENEFKAVILLL